jgi:hypothetical protein
LLLSKARLRRLLILRNLREVTGSAVMVPGIRTLVTVTTRLRRLTQALV